jgi:hypothetical protein
MKRTSGAPELLVAGLGAFVLQDIYALGEEECLQLRNPLRYQSTWRYDEVRKSWDDLGVPQVWSII